MLSHSKHVDRLDRVNDRVRLAPAVTADLISDLIAAACLRLPVLNRAGKAALVYRLIRSRAWTEAALALVEIELPTWKLRRLLFEDGKWLCSLSKQVNLPLWLDDTVDASHDVLPLAILSALLEARRRSMIVPENSPRVPQVRPVPGYAMSCDNVS
jgi:hypothetical protein